MVDYPNSYIQSQRDKRDSQQYRDNASWITAIGAGLGAIALGTHIYKSVHNTGGNVWANMMHFLGRPLGVNVNVENIANTGAVTPSSGTSGIRSFLTAAFNVKKKEIHLGPIDLIRDLNQTISILGNVKEADVREQFRSRTVEYINRKYSNYGNNTSFFSQNLQRITVEEVLANQDQWSKYIGAEQIKTLSRGVDEGIIDKSFALDKKIYKTEKGFLKDTRFRNLFESFNPETQTTELKFDLFGQGKAVRSLLGERLGVAAVADVEKTKGVSFFIGGNVFGYSKNAQGQTVETVVARNQVLRTRGDRLESLRLASEDKIKLEPKKRSSFLGQILTSIEAKTGVGPSFKNRYTFLERLVINPIKRLRGLASGKAVVMSTETVDAKTHHTMTLLDELAGADMPELVTQNLKPVKVIKNKVNFEDLSFIEKMLTLGRYSSKYEVIDKSYLSKIENVRDSLGGAAMRDEYAFVPGPPSGGIKLDKGSVKPAIRGTEYIDRVRTNPDGSTQSLTEYYSAPASRFVPGITSLTDFANYAFYRTSHLASESLLGISFAPAKTLIGNMARVAAVPIAYEAMRQGAMYADYLTEEITGISPIKMAASAYASLRIAQQKAREAMGIQQLAASAEENFPGSMDTGLSFVSRSFGIPAMIFGLMSKRFGIGKSAIAAAGSFALVGGSDVQQTSEDLEKEYSGQKKIAIRKGRFWGLGNQPFEGGEIERYDYSWYHKLMTDYKTKSVYGSEDEYWKYHANVFGIPLPTPSNLLGLRNVLNPYRLEEINKYSRPYEETAGMFEEVPVFGPILGSTIGKLIKPTVRRSVQDSGILPPGLDAQTASDMGIPELNSTEMTGSSSLARMQKMANIATEPIGIYKFVMEYFGIKFEPKEEELAQSNMIDSYGKSFYDKSLGGMFGQTEFLRRFMLSEYSTPSNTARAINRIANNMPDWLPGKGSRFKKDQDYFIDFKSGDPFSKIAAGESRLPGTGYEALNTLESGTPGEYSDVDKFLILADVAPYSEAYRHYEKLVSKRRYSPEWEEKIKVAKEQREKTLSIENRFPRYVDSLIDINERTTDSALYKTARSIYDTVTHDFLAEIPLLGSKLAPFRDPYEKYRKQKIQGSEFYSWYNPWEDIQRPILTDIALSDPIMGMVKGASIGFMLGTPFMSFASPVSLLPGMSTAGGAVAGAALSVGRIAAGIPDNYVPDYVVEQSEGIQYLDALAYTKARSLEMAAIQAGESPSEYTRLKRKTMIGANTPIMLRASLPTSLDKKYFDVFLRTPEANREKILEGVAPHLSYALEKAWEGGYYTQDQADYEAMNLVDEMPSFDSLAWHPQVDMASMKMKMITHGVNGLSDNYHRYGFYEPHEITLRSRLPDLWNENTVMVPPPKYENHREYFNNLSAQIGKGLGSTKMFSTPYGARYDHTIKIDRRNDTLDIVKGR